MLYLTTCVGLGTGGFDPHVEAFLDKTGSPLNPTKGVPITPHLSRSRVYLGTGHTLRHTQPPVCSSYHFVSPLLTRSPQSRSYKRPNKHPSPPKKGRNINKLDDSYSQMKAMLDGSKAGTRISTGYPSTTPVGLALGPD